MNYDAKCKMRAYENARQFIYDARNRLVEVNDAEGRPIARYTYGRAKLAAKARKARSVMFRLDALSANRYFLMTKEDKAAKGHVRRNQMKYDAKGNMTMDDDGREYVYDAKNRLVEIKDASGRPVASVRYHLPGEWIIETQQFSTDPQ